ncbi:MAG: histidine phosphatase family protein [Clostridia bacterium]|nr:histidine phosphatase family protein [Clostridia bacterium]
MRIIYVHHALRDGSGGLNQDNDITKLGEKDAKVQAEILSSLNKIRYKAIYTSPYYRCKKTALILNKKLNLPIFEDERLNEFERCSKETWLDVQTRITDCLHDIVNKYEDDDVVICVTSGVNVAAFINLAYKLKPSANAPFIGVSSCSPLGFTIDKSCF